jgi:hypothetical protein
VTGGEEGHEKDAQLLAGLGRGHWFCVAGSTSFTNELERVRIDRLDAKRFVKALDECRSCKQSYWYDMANRWWLVKGGFASRKSSWKVTVASFIVIWQNLSDYGLTRLKIFVSTFTDKLCNYLSFLPTFNVPCMRRKIWCDGWKRKYFGLGWGSEQGLTSTWAACST